MERETTADAVIKKLVTAGDAELALNENGVPCICLTEQGQRKAEVVEAMSNANFDHFATDLDEAVEKAMLAGLHVEYIAGILKAHADILVRLNRA